MRHIVFDFDGTIADSEHVALGIMNVMSDRHGFRRLTPEELDRFRKMPIRDRFRELGLPMRKLPKWAKEYNELFQDAVLKVNPFKGIPELLNQLYEQGYAITILSSNMEENIRRFLERHSLEFVKDILCSHRVFSKDRMIKRMMRRQRLRHEDIMYVGDEHRDVVACKRAGVRVIWVRWGFDGQEAVEPENPDFMADEPSDILGFIEAGLGIAR